MWDWIAWIILGAVAGWLASLIMGSNRSQGLLMDIIAGIVGAVVGGWIFGFFGAAPTGDSILNWYSLLVAIVGAIVVIFILRLLTPGDRVGRG